MEQMTPRQRVIATLEHQPIDRIPFTWGFGFNHPPLEHLRRYLNIDTTEEMSERIRRVDDIGQIWPRYIGPDYRNVREGDTETTYWGYRTKFVSYGEDGYNETVYCPLAEAESVEEIDAYEFPRADWFDFSDLEAQIDAINKEQPKAIRFGGCNPFEICSWLRGFENVLMDTLVSPELLHCMMRHVTDFMLEYTKRALEAANGKIDILFTADDLGSQNGLLMSIETIREFIIPYHKEINDLAHQYGAKVMFHSCGSCILGVEDLIGCGVDILESLQFYTVGMTPEALKDNFGDRICFQGGISVQKTLPYGTPEEVTQEVEHLKRVLGKNGGYLLAPAHAIQAGTPPENIIAALKAAGRLEELLA